MSTDVEIFHQTKNYYEYLYTFIVDKELSNEYDDIFLSENIKAKLTDDQKLSCEGEPSLYFTTKGFNDLDSEKNPNFSSF